MNSHDGVSPTDGQKLALANILYSPIPKLMLWKTYGRKSKFVLNNKRKRIVRLLYANGVDNACITHIVVDNNLISLKCVSSKRDNA